MNATELTKLTIKELKAIAQEKGIEVSGDKRSKATWVLALESALTQTAESIAEAVEPSPTHEKVLNSKSAPTLSTHTQSPNQRVGASIVALVVVLAFSVGLLVIKAGLTSIAWAIAALMPIALGLWRYLLPDPRVEKSIDYFPSAIA
jgi:phytoene dehydrogenase-like protein